MQHVPHIHSLETEGLDVEIISNTVVAFCISCTPIFIHHLRHLSPITSAKMYKGNIIFGGLCRVNLSAFFCLVLSYSLRVLSHLPHLVRLNRTRVCFPSWCSSFWQVRMQQSHLGAHQKRTKQAYRDLLEEVVSVRFQTNPGAVRLW